MCQTAQNIASKAQEFIQLRGYEEYLGKDFESKIELIFSKIVHLNWCSKLRSDFDLRRLAKTRLYRNILNCQKQDAN